MLHIGFTQPEGLIGYLDRISAGVIELADSPGNRGDSAGFLFSREVASGRTESDFLPCLNYLVYLAASTRSRQHQGPSVSGVLTPLLWETVSPPRSSLSTGLDGNFVSVIAQVTHSLQFDYFGRIPRGFRKSLVDLLTAIIAIISINLVRTPRWEKSSQSRARHRIEEL